MSCTWTRERLKAVRESLGLTQDEAARRIGVVHQTWWAWENEEQEPSKLAQEKLDQVFGDIPMS